MQNEESDILKALSRVHDLPEIPTAVTEILRVINDPNGSSIEVELAVSRDQVIAGKVLKTVNSALYGFPRRIGHIKEACVLLGLNRIRDITAGLATACLFKTADTERVQGNRLWSHGLATSLWSRKIIQYRGLKGMNTVITASLLHDIGILALHQHCSETYNEILESARKVGTTPEFWEKKYFKTTHAEVGADLCLKWQLPAEIPKMIRNHHSAFKIAGQPDAVLHLADYLADQSGFGPFEWCKQRRPNGNVFRLLKISENDMRNLRADEQEIVEQVELFNEALGEPQKQVPPKAQT